MIKVKSLDDRLLSFLKACKPSFFDSNNHCRGNCLTRIKIADWWLNCPPPPVSLLSCKGLRWFGRTLLVKIHSRWVNVNSVFRFVSQISHCIHHLPLHFLFSSYFSPSFSMLFTFERMTRLRINEGKHPWRIFRSFSPEDRYVVRIVLLERMTINDWNSKRRTENKICCEFDRKSREIAGFLRSILLTFLFICFARSNDVKSARNRFLRKW